jgi:hypothetical protein
VKQDHVIVGIHVQDRVKQVPAIQKVLTAFGGCIKTRLGLHDTAKRSAAGRGVIVLELVGSPAKAEALIRRLRRFDGVDVQKMVFAHD